MFELPLFPLNTVLFPGIPLRLHIFEPRYKQMLQYCLDAEQPFGVVLIRQGKEALGPLPQPHSIGTTAQIRQVDKLPLGRRLILAVGGERFRILALRADQPFYIAKVESSPLACRDQESLQKSGRRLRPGVERYFQLLDQAGKGRIATAELPIDPLALGYLAASILTLPLPQKQALLCVEDASDLLIEIQGLFRKEVALFKALLSSGMHEDRGRFPLN